MFYNMTNGDGKVFHAAGYSGDGGATGTGQGPATSRCASRRPMDAAELARGFKGGGKRIEQGVVLGLNTLVRYGRVTAVGDGRFAARRAA